MKLRIFSALHLLLAGLVQAEISVVESDTSIAVLRSETPILTYHTAEVPPPEGTHPAYHRSGFIHPLVAPGGGIVTGIHPDDHTHHLGLWHAWVKTEFGEHQPDFWNLKKQTGRVRYVRTKEVRESGFTVEQEQVAYLDGPEAEPTVILAELLTIEAHFIDGANVIDYLLVQTNVADKPLQFPAYRYGGGLAFRGPHSWNVYNCDYLTSEGLDRTNSHASRAKWVAMYGPAENGEGNLATVAILCHPKNRDAPQRIRTWDKGKVFFNYVPTQESAWAIEPRQSITLRYRIVILDGKVEARVIEEHWKRYIP